MKPRDLRSLPAENAYGHRKRLLWILDRLHEAGLTVEIGCGTGYMITLPLLQMGIDAYGIDVDEASIEYGRGVLREAGLDPGRLRAGRLRDLGLAPDTVVLSEVLEHLRPGELEGLLDEIRGSLAPGGVLLVTVPNGYGWFELESFAWNRLRVGRLVVRSKFMNAILKLKRRWLGRPVDFPHPATLSSSPHVRRFRLADVERLLESAGFRVRDREGSVLFAGPFTDLFLTGFDGFMRKNAALGHRFPGLAAGFYLQAVKV
jgi:SAM-dependent methyltransferase